MIKIRRICKPISIILIAIIISACMLSNALINGSIAYAADNELTADPNFNYNGYNSLQLKAISDCISDQPNTACPSYAASTHDDYTADNGTINTDNLPSGVSMPTDSRMTSNGSKAYHNTDSYSYCSLATSSNTSINKSCNAYSRFGYYLRSPRVIYRLFSIFSDQRGGLTIPGASENDGVIMAFAF